MQHVALKLAQCTNFALAFHC